jgi:hypothetical protein
MRGDDYAATVEPPRFSLPILNGCRAGFPLVDLLDYRRYR